jgi:hypothetical protein
METNIEEPALFVLQTFVDCFSKLSKPVHSIQKKYQPKPKNLE